jgi:glycosyltransferase involved in cell wall biosynthesis
MKRHPREISVIIPARNRLNVLRRVLDGLMQQELDPKRYQVLVVDDGSSDGTFSFVSSRSADSPFELIALQGRGEGAGAARNLAVAAARGRVILFLDADTLPSPSLVGAHLALYGDATRLECHMGRIDMSTELQKPRQARWNELALAADDPATGEIDFRRYRTANTSMSREVLLRTGGFRENLAAAEDLELAYRLARLGMRFYYHREVVAVHHHPLSLNDYFYKGSVYGQAVALWHRSQPELHTELARRFGLYDAGLSWPERFRYAVKRLLVNRASVHCLSALGKGCRPLYFAASNRLFRAVYGYHLRRSFRNSCRKMGE